MEVKELFIIKENVKIKCYFLNQSKIKIVADAQEEFLKQIKWEKIEGLESFFGDIILYNSFFDEENDITAEIKVLLGPNDIEKCEEFNLNPIWEALYENIA